jgi:hypothetical protein
MTDGRRGFCLFSLLVRVLCCSVWEGSTVCRGNRLGTDGVRLIKNLKIIRIDIYSFVFLKKKLKVWIKFLLTF